MRTHLWVCRLVGVQCGRKHIHRPARLQYTGRAAHPPAGLGSAVRNSGRAVLHAHPMGTMHAGKQRWDRAAGAALRGFKRGFLTVEQAAPHLPHSRALQPIAEPAPAAEKVQDFELREGQLRGPHLGAVRPQHPHACSRGRQLSVGLCDRTGAKPMSQLSQLLMPCNLDPLRRHMAECSAAPGRRQ